MEDEWMVSKSGDKMQQDAARSCDATMSAMIDRKRRFPSFCLRRAIGNSIVQCMRYNTTNYFINS